MKTRNESVNQAKGNGSAKPARSAGQAKPPPGDSDCSREQMIAEAAYFHAERRGFAPGNEMADWLQAEADLSS